LKVGRRRRRGRYDAPVTLIVTAITRQSVVMVADMRLTRYRTMEVVEEAACKMVVYLGRFIFGYTGPARLDDIPTGEWLAARLSEATSPETALGELARAAERAVAAYPPFMRKLAVVCAGWAGDVSAPKPGYATVSNFDPDSGLLRPTFEVTATRLERSTRARVFTAGVPMEPADLAALEDTIQRRAGRREERPGEFVAHLIGTIRREASRNRTVGRRLLVGSIPGVHHGVGPPLFAAVPTTSTSAPDWRRPEFRMVPRGLGEAVWWLPNLAGIGRPDATGQVRSDGARRFPWPLEAAFEASAEVG
jgi:hypothetical protein